VKVDRSSWVALRVLPSSHTNPVWVMVDGKPVRASRKSAEWCIKGIDKCWQEKVKAIRAAEQAEARQAYDVARAMYQKIAKESD
jgi:hypothetical protein